MDSQIEKPVEYLVYKANTIPFVFIDFSFMFSIIFEIFKEISMSWQRRISHKTMKYFSHLPRFPIFCLEPSPTFACIMGTSNTKLFYSEDGNLCNKM